MTSSDLEERLCLKYRMKGNISSFNPFFSKNMLNFNYIITGVHKSDVHNLNLVKSLRNFKNELHSFRSSAPIWPSLHCECRACDLRFSISLVRENLSKLIHKLYIWQIWFFFFSLFFTHLFISCMQLCYRSCLIKYHKPRTWHWCINIFTNISYNTHCNCIHFTRCSHLNSIGANNELDRSWDYIDLQTARIASGRRF